MKSSIIIRLVSVIFLACVILSMSWNGGSAQSPYNPLVDTFTVLNDPDTNFGGQPYLFLNASNLVSCVPTSYIWFKFLVPNPTSTITFANLSMPISPAYPGTESLDMELRSSADTSWQESTLTWSNQPLLDSGVLATALSTEPGNDALFSGSSFASYLNGKKGQIISLVVKANCAGSVAIEAARIVAASENSSAPQVELLLQGPNSITLSAIQVHPSGYPGETVLILVVVIFIFAFIWMIRGLRSLK